MLTEPAPAAKKVLWMIVGFIYLILGAFWLVKKPCFINILLLLRMLLLLTCKWQTAFNPFSSPDDRAPLGQHQEPRPLARLSEHAQKHQKSASHGLPVKIWQIWLAKNLKQILCSWSENLVRPEVMMLSADQNERALWGTRMISTTLWLAYSEHAQLK